MGCFSSVLRQPSLKLVPPWGFSFGAPQTDRGHNPALDEVDATESDKRGESGGTSVAKANGASCLGRVVDASLDKREHHGGFFPSSV